MAELPQPVLAIVPTKPRIVRNLLTLFRRIDANHDVYTLFAFGAGSDPVSVLREAGVVSVPFSASPGSHHVKIDLEGIVIVPDDIDNADGISEYIRPLLKANRETMNTEERKEDLYLNGNTAIYLGSFTYPSD